LKRIKKINKLHILLLVAGLIILSGLLFAYFSAKKTKVGTLPEQENADASVESSDKENSQISEAIKEEKIETELDSQEFVAGLVCLGCGPGVDNDGEKSYSDFLEDVLTKNNIPVPVFNLCSSKQDLPALEELIQAPKDYPHSIPIYFIDEKDTENIFDSVRRQNDLGDFSDQFPDRYLVIGPFDGNENSNKSYDYLMYECLGEHYLNFRDYIAALGEEDFNVLLSDADRECLGIRKIPGSLFESEGELNEFGKELLAQAVYDRLNLLNYLYRNQEYVLDRNEAKDFAASIKPGIGFYGIYDDAIVKNEEPDILDIAESAFDFTQIPAHLEVEAANQVWKNELTEEMLDSAYDAGFRTIRIPVAWNSYMVGDEISVYFMDELASCVEYFLDLDHDNKVILSGINEPWNELYFDNMYAGSKKTDQIWSQVATRFEDFDYRLVFEGFHRLSYEGTDWENAGGSRQAIALLNAFQDQFVKTVRSAGGENENRYLIINGYGLGGFEECFDGLILPNDEKLLLSISNYNNVQFVTTKSMKFDESVQSYWELVVDDIVEFGETYQVPLVMTEMGCVDKDGREDYLNYIIPYLKEHGIPYVWFDNGIVSADRAAYGLINRDTNEVYHKRIVSILTGNS